jgi:uncharacterized membrane protein YvlD (DUF360 family)
MSVSPVGSVRASLSLAAARIRRSPGRTLLTWVIQAGTLFVLGNVLPGVLVEDIGSALIATAVIAALNALVRPLIVVLTLPLTVATFGLLSLLINTSVIVLAAPLVPGMEINGFLPAFSLAIVLTVATTIVNLVLVFDEDETFYEELAIRLSQDVPRQPGPRPPGLVIVQIDGLAAPILRNAIRVGLVPRMAAWVRSDDHVLTEWECPPPSQTSASQAGILHGRNDGIPAFRWYEKGTGRLLVSNHPADAAEIERRVSDGSGLLHGSGSSVGNLLSGDAATTAFTMSTMSRTVGDLDIDAFSLYFVDPAAFIRTVVLTVGEFAKELLEARRQRVRDVQPRVHRGFTFAILRAITNVVLRDLNTTFVVRAMTLGAPIIYVDLADYDEIAHHAGPERLESLRALTGVDRVIASLERMSHDAGRDYRFIVLSDHGQSQGATFRQRHGRTLEEVVRDLMSGPATVVAATGRAETYGPVNALLAELAKRPGAAGRATRKALSDGGGPDTGIGPSERSEPQPRAERPDLVVCASGNLANAYFNVSEERLTVEEIESLHPGLVGALTVHPGVGFLLVRSADGPLVLGASGVHHLADGRIVGEDPLARFGPRAADHLRRLDAFSNVGDLLVNSQLDPDLGEVAAFEELVGSHGGLGGPQNQPFILHPASLEPGPEPLVGAPAVNRQLLAWARDLGVEGGPTAITPAPVGRMRALRLIAFYIALTGIVLLAAGLAILGAVLGGVVGEVPNEVGSRVPVIVALVLAGLGVVMLLTSIGIWRRQRWAWMVALTVQAIAVLQLILATASGGVSGIVSFGVLGAVFAVAILYYLTRPQVAAAFGRRTVRARPRRRSVG